MRWLITGGRGMLAADLIRLLSGEDVTAPGRETLDVRDPLAVARVMGEAKPDVVINCAAWTAVDDAETHEAEALEINGTAVATLAAAATRAGARLIHLSTDYVFDGRRRGPYPEDAPTSPINAYGRSKLVGERAALERGHYVVRTSWLYGAAGRSFVHTMIELAAVRETVHVVDDQRGAPTWTADLAGLLIRLARSDAPPGVYHGTSAGETTWYGFAREIFTLLGADPERVRPVPSSAFPRPARRPANSVLGHDGWAGTGIEPIRDWREALHAAWPSLRPAPGRVQ